MNLTHKPKSKSISHAASDCTRVSLKSHLFLRVLSIRCTYTSKSAMHHPSLFLFLVVLYVCVWWWRWWCVFRWKDYLCNGPKQRVNGSFASISFTLMAMKWLTTANSFLALYHQHFLHNSCQPSICTNLPQLNNSKQDDKRRTRWTDVDDHHDKSVTILFTFPSLCMCHPSSSRAVVSCVIFVYK